MPFTGATEYPASVFHTSVLTNTLQVVSATGIKVSHIILKGGVAAEIVRFREEGSGATFFDVSLGIGETVVIPRGFNTGPGGLEVITLSAAGDVYCTVFYAT